VANVWNTLRFRSGRLAFQAGAPSPSVYVAPGSLARQLFLVLRGSGF
jgi:hypothetical protein